MIKRLTLAVVALSCAASAAVYPRVPEPYFGIGPHQALSTDRLMIAFLLPAAAALIYAIFAWLSKRDTVRERTTSFEATYRGLVFRIVLFIVALHAVVLASVVSGSNLASRAVPVLLGLALIAVGDLFPRLRPNVAIGLRTPATFLNRAVWMRTHRVAGYATVGVGAVIVVAGLILPPRAAGNAILAAVFSAATLLAWYSRRVSRGSKDRK